MFATFLDTDGYIMRWQRLMILITLELSTLLVSIWFFYSRGANCCSEIRTILGCDPAGPCLGYEGNCGDLQTQFAELQGPFLYSAGVGEPPAEHMSLDDYGAPLLCMNALRGAWCCQQTAPTDCFALRSVPRLSGRRVRDGPAAGGPHLRGGGAAGGFVPGARL